MRPVPNRPDTRSRTCSDTRSGIRSTNPIDTFLATPTRRYDVPLSCRRLLTALPLIALAGIPLASTLASAAAGADEIAGRTLGAAGLFTGGARELAPLTLSVVEPMGDGTPYELVSGGYYSIDIVCDGSGELAIGGAGFFRSIWVDEVVINDIEVRPLGMESLEFDDEGTATLRFVAIRPGTHMLSIPGSSGDSQRVEFIIRGS